MYENLVLPPVGLQWWQKPEWLAFLATVFGVLVALATLWCVVRQLKLEGRQTDLAEQTKTLAQQQAGLAAEQTRLGQRQTEIIEKQDQLMARRCHLRLDSKCSYRILELRAMNVGVRTATDFYWYIFMASERIKDIQFGNVEGVGLFGPPYDEPEIGGKIYRRYTGLVRNPLYPGRDVYIGRVLFSLIDPTGAPPILWRISAEDGVFPGPDEYGQITLEWEVPKG